MKRIPQCFEENINDKSKIPKVFNALGGFCIDVNFIEILNETNNKLNIIKVSGKVYFYQTLKHMESMLFFNKILVKIL